MDRFPPPFIKNKENKQPIKTKMNAEIIPECLLDECLYADEHRYNIEIEKEKKAYFTV